jgi:dihydroflavonol-4-reductase
VRAYVSGASGFIGSHVVGALREAGWEVGAEHVDVGDVDGLRRAMKGADAVFHLAALYAFRGDPAEFTRVNVVGTRNVLEAARAAGVARVVYTSTCATCGPVPGRAATEEDEPPAWELAVPYKATKLEAEQLALTVARGGCEVVIVNPTTPVGEGDAAPTPTGRMVRGVATGRFRAYLGGTGVNLVDVRDVARGHLLAWERGRSGERYLLGSEDVTLGEAFAMIARAAGRRPPRLRVPYRAARAAAAVRLLNPHEIALARLPMWFSSEKARRELGYEPGPVEGAVERAVADVLGRPAANSPPVSGAGMP